MEESNEKRTKNGSGLLPPFTIAEKEKTPLQEISTENAFKLCRVGKQKNKFINFDLRLSSDKLGSVSQHVHVKIPLMVYNHNKFTPYRIENVKKSPRMLLVSRIKNQECLPAIYPMRSQHRSFQEVKFYRSPQLQQLFSRID